MLTRKIIGIILVILGLFAGHSLTAQTTVSLFKSYAGNINYIATGATLRSASNASNPCTVASSAAQSVPGMPSGSTIVAAWLYWCGSYSTATGSTQTTPDWTVDFGILFGSPTTYTATGSNQFTGTFTFGGINYDYFCGRADVTSKISASTSAVTYLLNNLSVNTATPHCATSGVVSGWSLVIVYSNTSNERLRVINLFDGLQFFYQSSLTLTVNNFRIDSGSPDAKITHITFEGDPDISGGSPVSENLTFKSFSASSATAVTNANNLTGNQFNSTITKSYPPDNTLVTTPPQHYGVDIDSYDVGYPIPPPASNTGRGLVISGDESAQTVYSSGDDMVILIGEVISVSNTAVADLSLSKTDNNINFVKGQTATYNFTVTNNGPNGYNKHPSNNTITVTDTLPSGLTFSSGSGTGWNFSALGQVVTATYTIGPAANSTLANGGTLNFSISASVGATIAASIVNTASVSGTLFDNQSANNTATDSTTVINGPNLSTSTKTVVDNNGGYVQPNDTLTYTITVTNSATYAASSVSVTDNIPANVTGFTVNAFPGGASNSSTGGGTGANGTGFLNITNISIPGSSSATITFTVNVSGSATSGTTIPNTATINNPYGPGATVNAPTLTVYTVSGTCDIAITGTYIEAENYTTSTPGTNAAYTFSIQSSVTGANFGQYVLTDNGAPEFPATGMRLDYPVNFTATGTYRIWMRANSPSGSADSTIWGVNYAQIGALTQGPDNSWNWTTTAESGSNTVTISTTGIHIIHLWTREPGQRTDGFFIIRTDQTVPAGLSEGATIGIAGTYIVNPNTCAIYSISGTVFEDINYGGGVGRSKAASSGVGITAARMELYSVGGSFIGTTPTTASGAYSFGKLPAGTYTVRAANLNVRSTRVNGSSCTTCIPVQTFRTNAASGTAVAVTDRVGGEVPEKPDAVDNTTLASLYSLTAAGTATPQSITSAVISASNITGVDFGFNFDTIVNINDSGQGSVRQFITNANTLGVETALAQAGLIAQYETSIFMIPNGQANPGHNTGYANQMTTSGANAGAAVISLATALPVITDTRTRLDGTTQTANVRATPGGAETNPGTAGTGGTVGVNTIALTQFNRPEVVLTGQLIDATGSRVTLMGMAIDNGALKAAGDFSVVQDNLVGMRADGTVGTAYAATYGITLGAGSNILVNHNYIKVDNSGIRGDSPGNNAIIEYNEVDSPQGTPGGGHTATHDGIMVTNTGTDIIVRYNRVKNQRGGGLEFGFGTGVITATATDNSLVDNGYTSVGVPSTETMGILAYSLAAGSAITFEYNIVTGNAGPGAVVLPGAVALTASGIVFTRNRFYANGGLGIDLDPTTRDPNTYSPADGVTLNDSGDSDSGPNGLLNYPIVESAIITADGNITITGWARPGSKIEFFIADVDPTSFGEGKTYLFTGTEGSGADTNSSSNAYGPGAVNGILQGTDTTNVYSFAFTNPATVTGSTQLTATATLAGSTSEFSGVVTPLVVTETCACGVDDGLFTLTTITIDGSMSDWSAVLADIDNVVCDGFNPTQGNNCLAPPTGYIDDEDCKVQSTGRDLHLFAKTWDNTNVYAYTKRIASESNIDKFIYYADTNNNGLMETGEPVIAAEWQGNNRNVDVRYFTYIAAYPGEYGGGDPMINPASGSAHVSGVPTGNADGYRMPGTLAGSGPNISSGTFGSLDGVQMEWSIPWNTGTYNLGIPPDTAFTFHVSSTNSQPNAASLPSQIDDNMAGCGGGAGGTQFAAVDLVHTPTDTPTVHAELYAVNKNTTVCASHSVTNNGNGSDTFTLTYSTTNPSAVTAATFYNDANGNGILDGGETTPITSTYSLAASNPGTSDTMNLIFCYSIANVAPQTPTVTVTATSTFNNAIDDSITDTIVIIAYPLLTNMKSVVTFSDPINSTTNPHAIPGAHMIYTIRITNSGGGTVDLDTLVILDAIPSTTELFVNSLGSSPSGSPIQFNDGPGALTSGLTLTFNNLPSLTDDISFSNDNGITWIYDPSCCIDGDGFNLNVTNIRINPQGTMNGASGSNNPYFELIFQVRVK